MHWLPTWKETPSISSALARALRSSAGASSALTPNLRVERIGRAVAGHGEAHDQSQILGEASFRQNLVEFVFAIERERLHAVIVEGAANGAAALHRVHERDLRVLELVGDQRGFGVRSDVEIA